MILEIDALDAEGRGVARNAGKVVFVEGAIAGERVEARLLEAKPKFDRARVTTILRASASRREPACSYFGTCGGCATQHVDARTQVAAKQRGLEDNLARIGKVEVGAMLAPIHGAEWGYRARARLSVRYVEGKGGALVGFRERKSTYVADMQSCAVLPAAVSALIPELRALISKLSIRDRVPQVEIAVGEASVVLLFRHLLPFTAEDQALLRAFAEANRVQLWLQPEGPDSAAPFHPVPGEGLYYALPEFGLKIAFQPADFTQVNPAVNRLLVSRALRLLDPQPGERIADMFCGIGNFALPIATRGAQVIGFEGSPLLVERARQNAAANGLVAQFEVADLFRPNLEHFGRFDKYLLDPPREGAASLVHALPEAWPRRIVYVSCDPATLARDADTLVHHKGFTLAAAGVVNMFPHTAHVESIALFERGEANAMTVTPIYAGILAILFFVLSMRVVALRGHGASLGDGGDPQLLRRIRGHGNFAEYVPFILLMMAMLELSKHSVYVLHAMGATLVVARLLHAYALSFTEKFKFGRFWGTALTYLVLVSAGVLCLYQGLRAAAL